MDLADLCLHLADNRYDWAAADRQEVLRSWMDLLDGHLLALSEECSAGPEDLDRLQEIMEGSLLFIQLRQQSSGYLTPDAARDILHARIRYIHRTHPEEQVRRRMYRLGMSLSSCDVIERERDQLATLFREAEQWFEWSSAKRADLLLRLSRFILQLRDTQPTKPVPENVWRVILSAWLRGLRTSDMCGDETIRSFTASPSVLSVLVEDLCGYRLPWGLNSILNYLSYSLEEGAAPLPAVCSYFSGMVKYGLDDPVAVCLVPYLDEDRRLALQAASVCPHDCEHPDQVIRWFLRASARSLENAGLTPDTAIQIIAKRDRQTGKSHRRQVNRPGQRLPLQTNPGATPRVQQGQRILVIPDDAHTPGRFKVLTLDGTAIGAFLHPDGLDTGVVAGDAPCGRRNHLSNGRYRGFPSACAAC